MGSGSRYWKFTKLGSLIILNKILNPSWMNLLRLLLYPFWFIEPNISIVNIHENSFENPKLYRVYHNYGDLCWGTILYRKIKRFCRERLFRFGRCKVFRLWKKCSPKNLLISAKIFEKSEYWSLSKVWIKNKLIN